MAAGCNEKRGNVCEVGTGMRMTMNMIRARFPAVQQMQTEELEDLINSSDEQCRKLVLLDVRSKAEFQVSHIANAHSINPNTNNMVQVLDIIEAQVPNPDDIKTVVGYCSVGYRSSSVIQDLMNELQKPEHAKRRNSIGIYNLEGSIFQWANENRPVINSENCFIKYVHPYNIVWGKLLNSELRSYGGEGR